MEKNKKTSLPEFLRPYFWDVRFEELEKEKHEVFVIKRVLDRGDTNSLRWVIENYGKDAIRQVVLTSRDLSRPTASFWTFILDLDPKQVPCLQKPYSRIPFGLSN